MPDEISALDDKDHLPPFYGRFTYSVLGASVSRERVPTSLGPLRKLPLRLDPRGETTLREDALRGSLVTRRNGGEISVAITPAVAIRKEGWLRIKQKR